MIEMHDATVSGLDLRLSRIRAGVTVTDLAVVYGCRRETLSRIERSAKVRAATADRYRRALAAAAR